MDEDNRSALEQEVVCVSVLRRELCMTTLEKEMTDAYNCIHIWVFHV